jgi:predicted outer membrane repeat protein
MQKRLSILVLLFDLLVSTQASHIYVNGTVSGSWIVDTVFVTGDLVIENGSLLTINSGTLVTFLGHYTFRVDGQLLALGTEQDSIVFTVQDTTGFFNSETGDGSWNGFWFDHLGPANDSTIFNFCRFQYGKAFKEADSTKWYGGAICTRQFNRIRISNCSFIMNQAYKNGGAVYARFSDIKVENSKFEGNFCGQDTLYGYGGGVCLEYSDAVIKENRFNYNSSTGVGGGLSFEYSDPTITRNIFHDNFSAIGGGMVCLRSNGIKSIVNNLFFENESYFFGGGVACLEATILFANNTIVQNISGAGGGLYFNANAFSVFKNNIIWGNQDFGGGGPQVYIWDTFSAPEFYYCDVQGGVEEFGGTGGGAGFIGVYENCLEIEPGFSGTGDHPFSLDENSGCINTGTPDTTGLQLPEFDLADNERFRGNRIDIGAYEAQITTRTISNLSYGNRLTVYPNPIIENSIITFDLATAGLVNLELLSVNGKKVSGLSHRIDRSGIVEIPFLQLMPKGAAKGYYLVQLKFGDQLRSQKVLIR